MIHGFLICTICLQQIQLCRAGVPPVTFDICTNVALMVVVLTCIWDLLLSAIMGQAAAAQLCDSAFSKPVHDKLQWRNACIAIASTQDWYPVESVLLLLY